MSGKPTSIALQPLVITSLQNERIKAVRALDMRKERKATGLFVAEGTSVLVMAKDAGIVPETVIRLADNANETQHAREVCDWASASGADVTLVSSRVLSKLSHKDNPQSLLGVFRQRWAEIPSPKNASQSDLWIALENVRDPGNLGTIIRTADAVGASGIILIGQCCDAYARDCVRATMGSIFSVPLVKMEAADFANWCRSWPGDVVATHLNATDDFRDCTFKRPVTVLMGSEGPGLSQELTEVAHRKVRIPMAGTLDSLNLAVATALLVYEVRRSDLKSN